MIKFFLLLFLTILLTSCKNNIALTPNIKVTESIEIDSKKTKTTNYNSLDLNKFFSKLESKHERENLVKEKAYPINTSKAIEEESINNDLRFFFFSDSHSRYDTLDKLTEIINKEKPELVLDGGDTVYDGTEPELNKAYQARQMIKVPVYLINGSHDVDLNGIFIKPPLHMPAMQSFDAKGIHFVLLDNESYKVSDELFKLLESDLELNKTKPIIVTMHVPTILSKDSLIMKIWKNLHLPMGSLNMKNQDEINRFTSLMGKYKVSLVLTGHTHKYDEYIKDGVKYITIGSTGGLTSALNVNQEFLDVSIKGKNIDIKRVKLKEGSKDPLSFLAETFSYLQDINSFNHSALGWNYYPSSHIQYDLGAVIFQTKNGESLSSSLAATIGRNLSSNLSVLSSFKLITGFSDLDLQLNAGFKYTIIGDYNRGIFFNALVNSNIGFITRSPSAGVGGALCTGIDYENFTFNIGYEIATNYKANIASFGYRF